MQPLADQMARAILNSKKTSVVVLDFFGPGENFTQLGKSLADNFNEDLKKSSPQFATLERSQLRVWLENKGWPSDSFSSTDLALWVAGQLKADAVVGGNISVLGSQVVVEVSLYRVDTRQWVKSFDNSTLGSDETRTLINSLIEETRPGLDPSIPLAGRRGYTYPSCSYCPEVQYGDEARQFRVQGSVVLISLVGIDGSIEKLLVSRALPDGLTESALETVRQWKFIPARGPDSKPAAVQYTIRISFHISHQKSKVKRH